MKRVLLFLVLIFSTQLNSQQKGYGSVSGTVIDDETGHPVLGANILIENTTLGSATDSDGKFFIKKVPAGRYILRISMVGYEVKKIEIEILPDKETKVSARLKPVAYSVEPIVVTAAKREQEISEVPVSTYVVDSKIISARNNLQIDDILRYVPGVNMIQYQVNIRGSSGYSRGTGSRVLILFDGVPFLTGDAGEIIWEAIPVWQIEKIEIIKGSGSALYGSNAIGGVINVLTSEPRREPSIRFRTYLGIYDKPYYSQWKWSERVRFYYGGFASFSGMIGNIGSLIHLQRTVDEGYKQNQNYHRWNIFTKFRYNPTAFSSVNFGFNYIRQKNETFFYWKSLNDALVPRVEYVGAMVSSERFNLYIQYKRILSRDLFIISRYGFFRNKWEDRSVPVNKSTASLLNAEVQLNYQPNKTHFLTAGVDGNLNFVNSTLFKKRKSHSLALYFQDEIKAVENLTLTLGLRGDVYKLDSLKYTGQVNPKFSAVLKLSDAVNCRVSLGTGFRAPAISETFTSTTTAGITVKPNPSIKPERSISSEIGARLIYKFISADIAIFENHYWNLIEPVFDIDGKVIFKNITRARIRGLEIGANAFLFNFASISLGYTLLEPWDLSENAILKYRPKHIFYTNANLNYKFIFLGVDFRYISKYERIDEMLKAIVQDADARVPIYVVDARVGLDFNKLKIFINGNNLLQYNYVEIVGNLGPIRNFNISVEYGI